jgi:ribosome-binding factor A
MQLCHQVAETLNFVLSGECDDDVLRNFYVVRVDPAGDPSCLLVTVGPLDAGDRTPVADVFQRLQRVSGKLRSEVASSISRRKVPQLLFRVVGYGEGLE